ncbi:zinc metallopeptidase [Methylobacillus gramineus]|uniref:KPN_02809 family neutral zinc metallopeptidase n=1 Tax=Methylobacillus gramineus TaxID=755169 RepID=UPI001CFFBE0F|nr:neutral zinc metallopeptidase [Methylobacillus gramineus]MCB5185100.1 zinc metallopeptidase [Methylobacillus gramineus]
MKWDGFRRSGNVEDRRGGGGGRSVGLGAVVIALLAGWIFGVNPLTILGLLDGGSSPSVQQGTAPAGGDRQAMFVSTVLASTEDVWGKLFSDAGKRYQEPKLVLFGGRINTTQTGCGVGESAMGPFYCSADHTVYIDLGFYETLERQLGAPGEFARAYVIAHEVGHHVQNLLGVLPKVDQLRARATEVEANRLSVLQELQADCLAGVWAHHADSQYNMVEAGDIESALNAAAQIGDDNLQKRGQGYVVPESFTHGSSEQRMQWFNTGYKDGKVEACDTFSKR